MAESQITIKGAREHNLKNVNVKIPRNKLVVITGLSGSGKSSLAFDTLYAEGQRRYLESLSSYARQFLEKLKKPEVDYISGLSPTIAIEQRSVSQNPRSTVGTVTEIYDYLRLLYAKVGSLQVLTGGETINVQTVPEIAQVLLTDYDKQEIQILAPVVRGRKGEFQKLFQDVLKEGFSKARIDGEVTSLKPDMKLKKSQRHDVEIVVDHLQVKEKEAYRLEESLQMAADLSEGEITVLPIDKGRTKRKQKLFMIKGNRLERTPNMFSFNSPYGACSTCKGLGKVSQIRKGGVILDESKALMSGGLNKDVFFAFNKYFIEDLLYGLTKKFDFEWNCPYEDWPQSAQEVFFWGDDEFSGLIDEFRRLLHESHSETVRRKVRQFLREGICKQCQGRRLKKDSLAVLIDGKNIVEMTEQSIDHAVECFKVLTLRTNEQLVADPILKEIRERLFFLKNVGLGYVSLDRSVASLSGGELQRIRLAAQIGVGLTGVLYVLDEPSIGLHPKDNVKLLNTLEKLRDMKNTVVVVEHDEETMRRSDHIIDLGPGAGIHGGKIVAQGTLNQVLKKGKQSLTAQYLSTNQQGKEKLQRKPYKDAKKIMLKGCREHNLKNINVEIPLGLFVCVTGVSGSGKSTLIHDTLYRELHNRVWKTDYAVGKFKSIQGLQNIDKVIEIDQTPIGRTPRSNPVTYIDLFTLIRKLFGELKESKMRRYTPSRFSFNLKGGRCEPCRGEGEEKLQMSFMPDLHVVCEHCRGKRYNDATLEIMYRGKNIYEVLDLSVDEGVDFFSHISAIQEKLRVLQSIGLGYLRLGQSSTTLSGGEAQRVKLAAELCKRSTGKTLYLLDEPTTGLHFADVDNLMQALLKLRDQGNTIVVIEHNLDVIKRSDYLIDLGPEGGEKGGELLGMGTPEELAKNSKSHTGKFLRNALS